MKRTVALAAAAFAGWALFAVSIACDVESARLDRLRRQEVRRLRECWRKAEESRSRAALRTSGPTR